MVPLSTKPAVDLAGKPALIMSGAMDPIAIPENAARLASALRGAGAELQHKILPSGHELSQNDVTIARGWLESLQAAPALS
jgi:phospholipase/carboxylesterase